MKRISLALAIALAAAAAAPLAHAGSAISGAGSSFAAPLYARWAAAAAAATGIALRYQAIGSGAGINRILHRAVDFGASDMPVPADLLATYGLLQFPSVIGGVDILVNLPGIGADRLKLTGPVLARIYLGEITRWNDPAIVALNPGLSLPALAITAVHRLDGSGTTFVFTEYLGMQSPRWKARIGASTAIVWPVGVAAKGSDGLARAVGRINGAIGYAESAYAVRAHLSTALLRNKAGMFVAPTMAAFAAAAASADWARARHFAVDLNDQPGAASWPIESASFVLLPRDPKDPQQNALVTRFFDWGFRHGGEIAEGLLYVPLPAPVQAAIRAAWKTLPGQE
ncbi:MAG: phosphate ABC transporter substrate-binding protein PstS [Rhodospirillales bacterium]|nr:phosphate ABC transporter substrate-binding protein PstS [Rhodospirillales bacterium]